MTEEERRKLSEKRRLVYENVANGVELETIRTAFKVSEMEIIQIVAFVGKKITEYRFRRAAEGGKGAAPPIACSTLVDARLNRKAALETLGKLGPVYLSSELILPKIAIQKVERRADVEEVRYRMRRG